MVMLLGLCMVIWIQMPSCSGQAVIGGWSGFVDQGCEAQIGDCGVGMSTRKRTCTNPPPQNGGANCLGLSVVPGPNCYVSCGCELSPCENNGTCQQNTTLPMAYTCLCPPEYEGHVNCSVGCVTEPCLNGGSCMQNVTDITEFSCMCPTSYSGAHCQQVTVDTTPQQYNMSKSHSCKIAGTRWVAAITALWIIMTAATS